VCGHLCTATAGQFLEIEATSTANAISHTVNLTTEVECGGQEERQRGGLRTHSCKSNFTYFNATACTSGSGAAGGAALSVDGGSFSATFVHVADCSGDNIFLNYAIATVTFETSNFVACTVENAVLSSNTVGITARYCVFRGSATPFYHAEFGAERSRTVHKIIRCWFDGVSVPNGRMLSMSRCSSGTTALYALAQRQSCLGESCPPPSKSRTVTPEATRDEQLSNSDNDRRSENAYETRLVMSVGFSKSGYFVVSYELLRSLALFDVSADPLNSLLSYESAALTSSSTVFKCSSKVETDSLFVSTFLLSAAFSVTSLIESISFGSDSLIFEGSASDWSKSFPGTASFSSAIFSLAPNHPDSMVAANAGESEKMNGALIGAIAAAIAVLMLVLIVLLYMRRKKSLKEPEAVEMTNLENTSNDISQLGFEGVLNVVSQYQDDDLWIGDDEAGNGDSIFADGFQESANC
jgi:hypothetical protein